MEMDNAWRKSSYSGGSTGECVEVGIWRKSSHIGGSTGDCVEVGIWRKSSYSGGSTGNCVEVAAADAILVRDTTDRGGVTLSLPVPAWRVFITRVNYAS